jgi:tyrosine-protein phosphatase YwqE
LRSEGSNTLLPIGNKGNYLLVETSYYNPPMRFRETLRQIKSLGYHPLLAHPERYMYMENNEYIELHEEGIKFQLNLASLTGGYGKTVKKKAEWLLKKELYSIAGSDLHCEDAIEFITKCKLTAKRISAITVLLNSRI